MALRLGTGLFESGLLCSVFCSGVLVVTAAEAAHTQKSPTAPTPQTPISSEPPGKINEPVTSFRTTIHHVVVDVVAKDNKGRPIRDLTEKDFQVFEKVSWVGKVPEKTAAFRLVDKTVPRNNAETPQDLVRAPPGAYTNLAAVREPDEPLTVLLLDGLNTNLYAPDARQQVLHMLDVVNSNKYHAPISVLLLTNNLHMLQDFTSDTAQARSAIRKILSKGPFREIGLATIPGPSPNMQQQFGVAVSPDSLPPVRNWDWLTDVSNNDLRVQVTLDAIRALARHLGGYPGRKKLVWLSGSFPFSILPDPGNESDNSQMYRDQIRQVVNALSSAQVAVYPIRPGGVFLPDVFSAAARNLAARAQDQRNAMVEEWRRQLQSYYAEIGTMDELANQTGGFDCIDSNDLGWCLKNVLADGYTYYELAYYPPAETWKRGFHRIIIRSTRPGVHLAFRQGYFVSTDAPGRSSGNGASNRDRELKQAACDDVMAATGIPLTVVPLPASAGSNVARYLLRLEGTTLASFAPPESGSSAHLQLEFAACTFDSNGKPLQYGEFPAQLDLTGYLQFKNSGFQRIFDFQVSKGVTQLRWLVGDRVSGNIGSVDVPYPAAPSTQAAENVNLSPDRLTSEDLSAIFPANSTNASDQNTGATAAVDTSLGGLALPRVESEEEVTAYCEGMGKTVPDSDALARACEFALSLHSRLPNLICDRNTARVWYENHFPARDEVTTRVAYQGGIEYDNDVVVGGKKTNSVVFRRAGSSSSGGEFSAALQAIFSPRSNPEFEFKGETTLGSTPALLFEYNIEQQYNYLYYLVARFLDGRDAVYYPAYHGQLWIARPSGQLLRVQRETGDIDQRFPIRYAATTINYDDIGLGDGTKFVLPTMADLVTCSVGDGKDCAHNTVHFANYHKFRATSRILFGQESQ